MRACACVHTRGGGREHYSCKTGGGASKISLGPLVFADVVSDSVTLATQATVPQKDRFMAPVGEGAQ